MTATEPGPDPRPDRPDPSGEGDIPPDDKQSLPLRERAKIAAIQVGTQQARMGVSRANNASRVAKTMERIRKAPPPSQRSQWLKKTAEATRSSRGLTGRSGARGQLLGHFIEELDNATYNAKNLLRGREQVGRAKAVNEAYDASRIIKGRFAGGIQQKTSAAGIERAVGRIERLKPGSARRATVRVPKDEVTRSLKAARGRIRVKGMDFTRADAGEALDRGLADLSQKGAVATSRTRALARGGAVSAGINAALGAVSELGAFRRGEISRKHFAENRVVDAVEGAASATAGSVAAGAGATAATAALGTSGGAAAAGVIGAAGTSALGSIAGMGAGGAAVASALAGVTVASAAPFVLGGLASIGVGVMIARGFKAGRKKLAAEREQAHHSDPTATPEPRALLALELPERFELQVLDNGTWLGEAQCLASQFTRNPDGSYVGSTGGSPIWLRCVEKHPGYFVHVDGGGGRFSYRLLPLLLDPDE